jgi:hypothetical protein
MMHTTIPPAADGPALDLDQIRNTGECACEYIAALGKAVQLSLDGIGRAYRDMP